MSNPVTVEGTTFSHAGVFRCCTGSLNDMVLKDLEHVPEEGEVVPCAHCTSYWTLNGTEWLITHAEAIPRPSRQYEDR